MHDIEDAQVCFGPFTIHQSPITLLDEMSQQPVNREGV